MENSNNFQETLSADPNVMMQECPKPVIVDDVGNYPMLLLPPGWHRSDLEELLPSPLSMRCRAKFTDYVGFAAYFKVFAGEKTAIFCDDDHIVAYFDFHQSLEQPGWALNNARFTPQKSPEWLTWSRSVNARFSQEDFADFLEDRRGDIVGTDSDLLSLVRQFRVTHRSSFVRTIDDTGTSAKLEYSKEKNIKAGNSYEVHFPKSLTVLLRPWIGIDITCEFTVRLRYVIEEQNSHVSFVIKIPNLEESFIAARKRLWHQIATELPGPIFFGGGIGA